MFTDYRKFSCKSVRCWRADTIFHLLQSLTKYTVILKMISDSLHFHKSRLYFHTYSLANLNFYDFTGPAYVTSVTLYITVANHTHTHTHQLLQQFKELFRLAQWSVFMFFLQPVKLSTTKISLNNLNRFAIERTQIMLTVWQNWRFKRCLH
jgi:hypothetical protein